MSDKLLLLNLAPWPTLLSLVRQEPQKWVVWGKLPRNVHAGFSELGVEVVDETLPKPFHGSELPAWIRKFGKGIVVPSLGQPLPTRWPIIRHIASMSMPVFAAGHGRIALIQDIPPTDAFTWSLEAGAETAITQSAPHTDYSCVRADLLGDLLLTIPAIRAISRLGSTRLIIRQEWMPWMHELLPHCDISGLQLVPWSNPCWEPAKTVVDLSPPDWASPLTPAIARAIPAREHIRTVPGRGLSEMVALSIGLQVVWPEQGCRKSGYGVFIPSGSSLERMLPAAYWRHALRHLSEVLNIESWIGIDPDKQIAHEKWPEIPEVRWVKGYREPSFLIGLIAEAGIVAGVSTALTHLAALCGTAALVVEHPTTVPGMYRAPVPYIEYVRPATPWWRDEPSEEDFERAIREQPDTYGFVGDEWYRTVDQRISNLVSRAKE